MDKRGISNTNDLLESVREVLKAHGREGRDFLIMGAGDDANSVEVLFQSNEFVSAEVTVALNELLYSFPDNKILLLQAGADQRPAHPKSGIRIALGQLDPIPATPLFEIPVQATNKTRALQVALASVLSGMGREDWRGQGDYWILDDWIGPYSQKVYVWKIEFITDELIRRIQQMLKNFTDCTIILSLDEAIPHLPSGIRVTADGVEEQWDRPSLRNLFGTRLKY